MPLVPHDLFKLWLDRIVNGHDVRSLLDEHDDLVAAVVALSRGETVTLVDEFGRAVATAQDRGNAVVIEETRPPEAE